MSFDGMSVPLNSGNHLSQSLSSRAMSFDKKPSVILNKDKCLNPFRAGRCLSTLYIGDLLCSDLSQSLSSRAMSFDQYGCDLHNFLFKSQSLSSRAMSFDGKHRETI